MDFVRGLLQIRENLFRRKLRLKLKNKEFCIISDDCWGGRVYTDAGIPYTSPTVNLFIYSSCFLKLAKDVRGYLSTELTFLKTSKYPAANENRQRTGKLYPIGKLKDIEIHFLHSKDETDADTKWQQRLRRVDYDNLYFKFSDAYLVEPEDLVAFERLQLPRSVIFTARAYKGLNKFIWLSEFEKVGRVMDPFKYRWVYRNKFDVADWLNQKA